jgi:hypothetical protein
MSAPRRSSLLTRVGPRRASSLVLIVRAPAAARGTATAITAHCAIRF